MTNILNAIYNIISNEELLLKDDFSSQNRANNLGKALENYMKDAFANTFVISNEKERKEQYNQSFSWLGSSNSLPDFMIKSGDAIEVKKIENKNAELFLNSSYPKSKLYSGNITISKDCRNCEEWDVKDIIYAIGHAKSNTLKYLWMVYGSIYAADYDVYERIRSAISLGTNQISDIEFTKTNELARINNVDPLGVTNLRVRGMWSIQNPRKVFDYIYPQDNNFTFELVCIIPSSKYYSFEDEDIARIESIKKKGFNISNEKVSDPNNPAKLIDVKLITFTI